MTDTPDALLFISSQCPHCPGVLAGLGELVKRGAIGRLQVVNIARHPEQAESLGVRSVPWLRLGPFELSGARTLGELETWARRAVAEDGMAEAMHDLLKTGALARVLALLADDPARLRALLPIVANPEASINVRVGVGAVFEDYAGGPALRALLPDLGELTRHADARVRADACHYLALAGDAAARAWLRPRLRDASAEVREIARDSLHELGDPA